MVIIKYKIQELTLNYLILLLTPLLCAALPDIRSVEQDLKVPQISEDVPSPEKRVKQQLDKYKGSDYKGCQLKMNQKCSYCLPACVYFLDH